MDSVKEDKERLSVINGFRYMAGTTQEFLDGVTNHRLTGNEIFIASFPKCGQLWLTEIIWQILHDGMIDETPTTQRNIFIDISPLNESISASKLFQRIQNRPGPKVIQTHYLPSVLPKMLFQQVSNIPVCPYNADIGEHKGKGDSHTEQTNATGKVIYPVRNPWDVAVSWFHHLRSPTFSFSSVVNPDTTWDEFFELFLHGKILYGTWFDHVLAWLEHRHQENILFIKYEDIKMDHAGAVKRIAQFLGKNISDETTNKIVRQTTVDAMQNGKAFQNPLFQHVRKGVIGDWVNYFSDEQNQRLQQMYDVRMAGTGLDFKKE